MAEMAEKAGGGGGVEEEEEKKETYHATPLNCTVSCMTSSGAARASTPTIPGKTCPHDLREISSAS
ncbi:hypothetical protein DY000_02015810 [Brassica cretica]|uniref:Uncharacterized protein n=1 Tax=Brassica cretica TaxID=69181 RepID=A0ABQ7D6S5_BRACR|nr:hypothetical protein DY000_02015810 [Brassica cretica]